MKRFGLTTLVAGALTAGVVGVVAPAADAAFGSAPSGATISADIGHHDWVNDQSSPDVSVPHVDTTVHQSH